MSATSSTTSAVDMELVARVATGLRRLQASHGEAGQLLVTAKCVLDDLAAELGQQRLLRQEIAALLDTLTRKDGVR